MNRREAERLTRQADTLRALGFTSAEAESLRRISMTLRRWHEAECNGDIQRGEDGVARGYRVNARFLDPNDPRYWYSVPDRETGAKKRLAAIIKARNERERWENNCPSPSDVIGNLSAYIQGDPRGAALYILRPGDVPEGKDAGAYYSRGVCVY